MIDQEVRLLVEKAYGRAKDLIIKHRSELEKLANLLLEKEVVVKDDLEKIFGKKPKKVANSEKKNTSIDQEKYSI
jgi:cell division protease FtsH